jgi:tetratricopeptide (TPR) repeat protein
MELSMTFYKTVIAIFLGSILCLSSAFAKTSYGDIQLLIKQGQYKEALKLTEDQLSQNKSDIKLQFMKGLVLTRLDRYSDAEKVFIQLTKENPDLPEPFNNLAVVYAAQGKYSQAEEALKGAINTHPSYATAHENLGDIYAKMASRAYNQALELDTSNKTAREKLSLVNELISAPPEPEPEKTVVAIASPEPKAELELKPEKKPVAKPVQEPEIITIPAKKEPKPVRVEEKPVLPPIKKVDVEEDIAQNRKAVESAANNWANAWSAQDVDTYLASYAKEFVPPKRLSRGEWEKDRRKRLQRPSFIKVTLSNLKINLHGKDYAEVRFTQRYQSDTYGDKVKKEILMRKVGDKWLITQERSR